MFIGSVFVYNNKKRELPVLLMGFMDQLTLVRNRILDYVDTSFYHTGIVLVLDCPSLKAAKYCTKCCNDLTVPASESGALLLLDQNLNPTKKLYSITKGVASLTEEKCTWFIHASCSLQSCDILGKFFLDFLIFTSQLWNCFLPFTCTRNQHSGNSPPTQLWLSNKSTSAWAKHQIFFLATMTHKSRLSYFCWNKS